MDAYIYVIGTADGPLKIGYARDPEERLSALQTGTADKLILFRKVRHPRAQVVESRVHKALRSHRHNGEWFVVSVDQALQTIEDQAKALLTERTQRLPSATTTINVKAVSVSAWEMARAGAGKRAETMGAYLSRAIRLLAAVDDAYAAPPKASGAPE